MRNKADRGPSPGVSVPGSSHRVSESILDVLSVLQGVEVSERTFATGWPGTNTRAQACRAEN